MFNVAYWAKKKKVPDAIVEAMGETTSGRSAVDVGCAGGRMVGALSDRFDQVFGIDVSSEVLKEASVNYPKATFLRGRMTDRTLWEFMGPMDLIMSNCAIRKDYCDIQLLSDVFDEFLSREGKIILRIQLVDDLKEILTSIHRSRFYETKELQAAFSKFDTNIKKESYRQKFSSVDYVERFLRTIEIPFHDKITKLFIKRSYAVVVCTRKK